MSVSIGVFTATAMFLAIGDETESAWGLHMFANEGVAPCHTDAALVRHLRLLDAHECEPRIFVPYPLKMLPPEELLAEPIG